MYDFGLFFDLGNGGLWVSFVVFAHDERLFQHLGVLGVILHFNSGYL